MDFNTLDALQKTPADGITAFLASRGWQQESKHLLSDLNIERWVQGADHITVEYGPGYDNSVIYQTMEEPAYQDLAQSIDLDAMREHAQKATDVATYTAYRDGDDIIILGEPLGDVGPYTVIVTTILNIDALWLESEYIR